MATEALAAKRRAAPFLFRAARTSATQKVDAIGGLSYLNLDDHNPLWRYKYPMKQPLYVYICTPFLFHPLSCIVLCLQLRLPF